MIEMEDTEIVDVGNKKLLTYKSIRIWVLACRSHPSVSPHLGAGSGWCLPRLLVPRTCSMTSVALEAPSLSYNNYRMS